MSRSHTPKYQVPQATQAPWRERMKRLREGSSLMKSVLQAEYGFATGTINNYENHDLSTMQIGYLWRLSEALNIPFVDMMTYIFTDHDNVGSTATQRAEATEDERFVTMVMHRLPPELQSMVREQVTAVADYSMTSTTRKLSSVRVVSDDQR